MAAAAGTAFAAPPAATHASAAPGLGSAFQTLLALALVLGAIFALAWLLRRLKTLPSRKQSLLRCEAELALGDKERVVLLAAGSQKWLLGVTAGGIQVLQAYGADAPAPAEASSTAPAGADGARTFAALLRSGLGLKP